MWVQPKAGTWGSRFGEAHKGGNEEEEEEAGDVTLAGQGKREYACTRRRKKENQRHKEGSEASAAAAAALYYNMYAHDSPSADHAVGPGVAAPITPSADHAVGPGVRVRAVAIAKKLRKEGVGVKQVKERKSERGKKREAEKGLMGRESVGHVNCGRKIWTTVQERGRRAKETLEEGEDEASNGPLREAQKGRCWEEKYSRGQVISDRCSPKTKLRMWTQCWRIGEARKPGPYREGGSSGSGMEKGDGGLGSDSRSLRAGRGDDANDSKSAWERIGHEHWRRTGAAGEARSGDHGEFESAARGRSAFDEAENEDPMDMLDEERQFNMGKEWEAQMWASELEGVDSLDVDSGVNRETVASQKGAARRRVDEGRKEDQLDAYLDGIMELEGDKGGWEHVGRLVGEALRGGWCGWGRTGDS